MQQEGTDSNLREVWGEQAKLQAEENRREAGAGGPCPRSHGFGSADTALIPEAAPTPPQGVGCRPASCSVLRTFWFLPTLGPWQLLEPLALGRISSSGALAKT